MDESAHTSQLLYPRLTFGCRSHTTGAGFGALLLPTLLLLPAAAGSGLRGACRGGGSGGTGQRPASETLRAGLKSSMPGWPALRLGGLVKYRSPAAAGWEIIHSLCLALSDLLGLATSEAKVCHHNAPGKGNRWAMKGCVLESRRWGERQEGGRERLSHVGVTGAKLHWPSQRVCLRKGDCGPRSD